MTVCSTIGDLFPTCKGRKIEADFGGGNISSDAGVLLLRQADRKLGLMKRVAKVWKDPREQGKVDHPWESLLRQRVYAIASGYEDLNDHDHLRHDLGLQTAVERDEQLASCSTVHRAEQAADSRAAWKITEVLIEAFIASHREAPEELILDFDATNDPVHGHQEGRFFHGYYDEYCFLPLYVFCGDQLLVALLQPSKQDGAKYAPGILKRLVKRFREVWPEVRIILRGDSGFCRHRMLDWCDENDVGYIVGLAKNRRVEMAAWYPLNLAKLDHLETDKKIRRFTSVQYAAKTWSRKRRVLVKAECTTKGFNPRFVVTNLKGRARALYDGVYCARGDMENRIKEQQLGLFADRTSCRRWWANQLRLLLSSLAYVLMETIRRLGLKGTELERAQVGTLRLKLLKIGAIITRNTRRIRIRLSSACPYQDLFMLVAKRLATA